MGATVSSRCSECGQGEGSPSEVESLRAQVAEANRVIEKMQTDRDRDVSALKAQVADLEKQVAAQEEVMEERRGRAKKAEAQVAALTDERDQLQGAWDNSVRLTRSAEAEVTRLKAQVNSVTGLLLLTDGKLHEQIAELTRLRAALREAEKFALEVHRDLDCRQYDSDDQPCGDVDNCMSCLAESLADDMRAAIAPEGKADAFTELAASQRDIGPDERRAIYSDLPGLYTEAPEGKAKP